MLIVVKQNLNSRRDWIVATLVVFTLSTFTVTAAHADEPEETIRLRMAWGGGTAVQWAGRLSLSSGSLVDVGLLGRERDTPGSIWNNTGTVLIAQPGARTFDGLDVTARAPADATLRIELRAAGDEQSNLVEIPISELMASQRRTTLTSKAGGTSTTLLVRRVSDDALRIELDRPSRIFKPGETLRMVVEPAIAGIAAGAALDLSVELMRGRGGSSEWSNTVRASMPVQGKAKVPVEIPLPMTEGVYTIKLAARTPPGNRVKFWETATGDQLAQRTFQVLVLGDTLAKQYSNASWRTTLEIDPANPKWWSRLSEWTRFDRIAHLGSGPLGSEPFRTVAMAGRTLAELSPSQANRPTWQAYPLPAAEPGKPHVVEVELPAGYAQQLAIRIYERGASGKLVANGPGSGVVVQPEISAGSTPVTETCRYLFWPRTKSPVAVIENAREDSAARFGKIQLRIANRDELPLGEFPGHSRMVAAYFDWPTLLSRTGSRLPTADGRPAVDDLEAFYQLAHRTADLLELSGYNSAVVNVMDRGSAAFDTGKFTSLPLLDTSVLGSGGTDLPRIDPTDLLLRVFESRGLRLVPTLRFNATLPGVEANVRAGKYRTLEDYHLWTDLAGRPRRSVLAELSGASAPHYRAAHPDVAAEVQSLVSRLASRSAQYKSFAGVGVELSSDSYLASPPSSYGITVPRLARLARAMDLDEATLKSWTENPALMLESAAAKRAWNVQRAAQVTDLLGALAGEVEKAASDAKLMVVAAELFDSRELEVRPQLIGGRRLGDLFIERGIDLQALSQMPGVWLPGTWNYTVGLPLVDAARPLEHNARAASGARELPVGSTVWHRPASVAVPRSEEFVALQASRTLMPFDLAGTGVNVPIAHALSDDTGGPLVIGGPAGPGSLASQQRRAMLQMIAMLPAGDLQLSSSSEQPVVAKVYAGRGSSVAMATNDSPWPVTATISLKVAERTTGQRLAIAGDSTSPSDSYAAAQHAWRETLAPYETKALQFATEKVSVQGVRVVIEPAVQQQLAERCMSLERQDLKPDALPTYAAVTNPSFEQLDADGWAVGWQSETGVATATPGVDGQRAAVLKSDGSTSGMSTIPFATPATGQIAVTAQVKVVDLADVAELRLIVEDSGRRTTFSQSADQLKQHSDAKQWNVYQFGVEDLPLDSTSEMRIRVELTGAGEVWIDHLQLHELVYPQHIYPRESDQQVLALVQHVKNTRKALDARQYRDCLTLLDSYWSRFLLEHLPEIESPSTEALAPVAPAEKPEETPKLTERVRDWFRFK